MKTFEDFGKELQQYLDSKEDTSDEAINLASSLDELKKDYGEEQNWKTKYEENDKAWRIKYRNTFLNTNYSQRDEGERKDEEHEEKKKTYESLFKTEE